MSLADRLRRFRPRRRPSVELVRLQPVELAQVVEPLALPAPPRTRRPSAGLTGYGSILARDPYATGGRPDPLGRGRAYEPVVYDRDQLRAEYFPPRPSWPYSWERRDS